MYHWHLMALFLSFLFFYLFHFIYLFFLYSLFSPMFYKNINKVVKEKGTRAHARVIALFLRAFSFLHFGLIGIRVMYISWSGCKPSKQVFCESINFQLFISIIFTTLKILFCFGLHGGKQQVFLYLFIHIHKCL